MEENEIKKTDQEPTLPVDRNEQWVKASRTLGVGVSFATMLLLLYNVFLFVNPHDSNLWTFVVLMLIVLACGYFCINGFIRGLSRFSVLFEGGGKRSLFFVRWSFILTCAGVVLHLLLVYNNPHVELSTVNWTTVLVGSLICAAATVMAVVGFLSLSTCKGMHDDARLGALHLAWVSVLLVICTMLFAVASQKDTLILKICSVALNLLAAYCFYHNWHRVLRAESQVPQKKDPEQTDDKPEAGNQVSNPESEQ